MPKLYAVFSTALVLFSVIDILGSIPIILNIRKRVGHVYSLKSTLISGVVMLITLFVGEKILALFRIGVEDFSIAGGIVLLLIGLEMTLGLSLFGYANTDPKQAAVVPIAFPLIAGPAVMTTIITLRAHYQPIDIAIGILINLALVFSVLKLTGPIERILGQSGVNVVRTLFGIILLALAIRIFRDAL